MEKLQNNPFHLGYAVCKTRTVSGAETSGGTYGEHVECLTEAREKKQDLRDAGDMAGYKQALQAYEAMCNSIFEPKYISAEGLLPGKEEERIQVEYKSGELTSGILDLGGCGNGLYSLRYAQDSTAENPIVEVRVENLQGTGKNTYFVDVNAVDVKNAAEMEIFALLAHYEKQGMTAGNVRLYEQGRASGIFQAENLTEFLYEKKNWSERFAQFSDSDIGLMLQELLQMNAESESAVF